MVLVFFSLFIIFFSSNQTISHHTQQCHPQPPSTILHCAVLLHSIPSHAGIGVKRHDIHGSPFLEALQTEKIREVKFIKWVFWCVPIANDSAGDTKKP
uniref:Putative secreted protein n=1 Tax=Anopheles darlingi TaxID=43151 RepID=A0A2M4DCY5_ANODA